MEQEAYAYLEHMEELKTRLSMADAILDQAEAQGPNLSHYELMALHLRKLLELIAFSSLVAQKEKYAQTYAKYASHWNAKRLLENLRAINADYYPRPIELLDRNEGDLVRFEYVQSGYLTVDEFLELYDRASVALHTSNPFAAATEMNFGLSFSEWRNRIVTLMRLHQIRLVDMSHYWIVMLASAEHEKASLIAAVKVDGAI